MLKSRRPFSIEEAQKWLHKWPRRNLASARGGARTSFLLVLVRHGSKPCPAQNHLRNQFWSRKIEGLKFMDALRIEVGAAFLAPDYLVLAS